MSAILNLEHQKFNYKILEDGYIKLGIETLNESIEIYLTENEVTELIKFLNKQQYGTK